MNRNLFFMEFSRYRNSMLIWTTLVSILIIVDLALFQIFLKEGIIKSIEPIINQPFLAPMMKGFGLEIQKLTNILGFYVIRNTPLILLLTGIFAILTSISLFANEEYEKTAEFLYTKPLTRSQIFISKVLSAFLLILLMNIFTILVGYFSLEIFKNQDYNKQSFFLHSIYGLFTSFTFASIGFTFASIAKRGRGLFALSVGIVMGAYFLDLMSKIAKSTEFIGYISPFFYVDNNILVENFTLNMQNSLIFISTITILTLFSYFKFLKKDFLN